MNYSVNHIRKAFELCAVPSDFAEDVISRLPEAQMLCRQKEPEDLHDLFEQFCFMEKVSEDSIRYGKRSAELFEMRLKFSNLAKVMFPKTSQAKIGSVINRDHVSVLRYFKIAKARQAKAEKRRDLINGMK